MHPSDFGYAVGKSVREACLAKSMHDYYEDGCYEIDWLESSSRHEWILNPVSDSSSASYVFQISFHGYLTADYSAESTVIEIPLIHPVIYLKSNVLVTGGTGSFEDPYIAS